MSEEQAVIDEAQPVQIEQEAPSSVDNQSGGLAEAEIKRISVLTARNYKKDQEIAQLKAALETTKALESKAPEVEVPELPDEDLRYEDKAEYERKLQAYHDSIAAQAVSRAEQQRLEKQKAEAERAKQEQLSERHTEIVTGYIENGLKSGISEARMAANEEALRSSGLNSDIAEFIYSDPAGAKIVDYLASNPDKMQELAQAPTGRAFIAIENEIKSLALSTKPTHTQAPEPIQPTRGSGAIPTQGLSPILVGATFE